MASINDNALENIFADKELFELHFRFARRDQDFDSDLEAESDDEWHEWQLTCNLVAR